MSCEPEVVAQVLERVGRHDSPRSFGHPEKSILARGYRKRVPVTVHASIGTDVIDQHPGFCAAAKGGTRRAMICLA